MKNNHRSGALDVSALHLLHRAGQCAEVLFTNETGKADLTPRQYAILASVAQNPDISQTGLVEQTGVDRSTLADIVRRLVKKGLLQQEAHAPRRAHVRGAPDVQGAGGARPPSSRPLRASISACCRCSPAGQRGDFIEALGEIVQGHEPARPPSTVSQRCATAPTLAGSAAAIAVRRRSGRTPCWRRPTACSIASARSPQAQRPIDDRARVRPVEPCP